MITMRSRLTDLRPQPKTNNYKLGLADYRKKYIHPFQFFFRSVPVFNLSYDLFLNGSYKSKRIIEVTKPSCQIDYRSGRAHCPDHN